MIKSDRINKCKTLKWEQLGLQEGLISSPIREDRKPSLSLYVRGGMSYWKDHATGEGGSIIDFIQQWKGKKFPETIEFIESLLGGQAAERKPMTRGFDKQESSAVINYVILTAEAAKDYIVKVRHIAPQALIDIEFHTIEITNKHYKNIYVAFPINEVSFECRAIEKANPVKQRKIGPASIWQFGTGDEIVVTESIIDALSWRSLHPNNDVTLVSLNSVSNWRKLFEIVGLGNRKVTLCLDNDQAGDIATQQLTDKIGRLAEDRRGIYNGFKDLNEMLCSPTIP